MRTENECGQNPGNCWDSVDLDRVPSIGPDIDSWQLGQLGQLGSSRSNEPTARMTRLVRTVEAEIVPRLMLMRATPARLNTPDLMADRQLTDDQDVVELTRLLLAHDVTVAGAFVEAIVQRGLAVQQVCLELLAPAARRLGVMWERDECDFMQVTLGLCRLHQVLHQLSSAHRNTTEQEAREHARRALIVPLPGEQHTFGVIMVSQFFRVAGWSVCNEFPRASDELADLVRDSWFAVAGLSVGSEVQLQGITDAIKTIRRASRNKAICVLVGGPIFVDNPALASVTGADGTAADGKIAVQVAETMFTSLVAQI